MAGQSNDFISKAKLIHGSLYDYSKVIYVKAKLKVCIICPKHGEFLQTPNNHLSGNKCPMCRGRFPKGSKEKEKYELDKAISIHGNKYNYSLVNFSRLSSGRVTIICSLHGQFEQLWQNHTHRHNKHGCPCCARANASSKQRLDMKSFIEKSIAVHGKKYDYSKSNYMSAHKKITIICKNHGEFQCTPANHWSNGVGCPKCLYKNPSKGETKIAKWLDNHNMVYTYQKSYPDLWYKSKNGRLKYDFWIHDFNMLIEYDGQHHYQPFSWSKKIKGKTRLKEQKIKDQIKTQYAIAHKIKLVRIKYDEDIETILNKLFKIDN